MEITLEAIISLIGLFVGGGGGAFFMWKWQKKKAKAEAESAEIDAAKEMQGLYKQMLNDANEYLEDARQKVDGLRQERDHYKQDRDELRGKVDNLVKMFYELKTTSEKERSQLRVDIATLQSQLRGMVAMTCSVQDCKMRQIILFDLDKKKQRPKKADIDPNNEDL